MSDPTPFAADPPAKPTEIPPEVPPPGAASEAHSAAGELAADLATKASEPAEGSVAEPSPFETTEKLASPQSAPPAPARRSGMGPMPVIYGIGFIIIVVALVWLWQHPNRDAVTTPAQDATSDALHTQVTTLAQQMQDLSTRVAALENRPAPVAASAPAQAVELAPLEARLTALENRRPPAAPPVAPVPAQPDPAVQAQAAQTAAQIAALTDKVNQLGQVQAASGDLATRLDNLARSQQSADSDLSRRLATLSAEAAAGQRQVAQIAGLADTAQRTARIQAAAAALAAGQKLGPVPGAPPPLARFADTPPPTEAALRLSFPAAATAAERASRPDLQGKPILTRLWLRAQQAVTIREDDRVIIGDPAAGIIARARRALDAGDLAGAVGTLGTLNGAAAEAMADWLGQARALLAARAALATLSTSG